MSSSGLGGLVSELGVLFPCKELTASVDKRPAHVTLMDLLLVSLLVLQMVHILHMVLHMLQHMQHMLEHAARAGTCARALTRVVCVGRVPHQPRCRDRRLADALAPHTASWHRSVRGASARNGTRGA